jgi:hypothetical protein
MLHKRPISRDFRFGFISVDYLPGRWFGNVVSGFNVGGQAYVTHRGLRIPAVTGEGVCTERQWNIGQIATTKMNKMDSPSHHS